MAPKRTYFIAAMICLFMGFLILTVFQTWGFIRGFMGDLLVVMFLYCLAKSFYSFKATTLALAVWLFACATEVSQYFKLADKLQLNDRFSEIVLGSTFDFGDILAYTIGILLVYGFDTKVWKAV